jgi:hypothetical protein
MYLIVLLLLIIFMLCIYKYTKKEKICVKVDILKRYIC